MSDNLMLTLCGKMGYHVHSVVTQHYKCFNNVDAGYSKSLQFKDLTKSKQDIKGVYLWCIQKSMATVQSASADNSNSSTQTFGRSVLTEV